jgi:type VI secretion system protein ImpA
MEREARNAGAARLRALREETAETLQAWQAMGDVLDGRAGADSPPTSRIRELLQRMEEVAEKYAPGAGAQAPSAIPGAAAGATTAQGRPASGMVAGADGGATREDMLLELGRISEFFRRTEPHSPLAYTLEEAVRRGRMSWPELLEEIVPDQTVRSAIQMALGIKPAEAG